MCVALYPCTNVGVGGGGGGGGFFSGFELLKQMHPYFKGVLVFIYLGLQSNSDIAYLGYCVPSLCTYQMRMTDFELHLTLYIFTPVMRTW